MEQNKNNCCENFQKSPKEGFLAGILYGLMPHSFCLAFILFSIIGTAVATAFLKKFLLLPYLFPILVVLSIILAAFSSFLYLKRADCLCVQGLKDRWKYIAVLFSSTIAVNLLVFFAIIPLAVNINPEKMAVQSAHSAEITLEVNIPCSGHASLIIDELKKDPAVQSVKYKLPDNFEIKYDWEKTSQEKIIGMQIFKTYPATIIN